MWGIGEGHLVVLNGAHLGGHLTVSSWEVVAHFVRWLLSSCCRIIGLVPNLALIQFLFPLIGVVWLWFRCYYGFGVSRGLSLYSDELVF